MLLKLVKIGQKPAYNRKSKQVQVYLGIIMCDKKKKETH